MGVWHVIWLVAIAGLWLVNGAYAYALGGSAVELFALGLLGIGTLAVGLFATVGPPWLPLLAGAAVAIGTFVGLVRAVDERRRRANVRSLVADIARAVRANPRDVPLIESSLATLQTLRTNRTAAYIDLYGEAIMLILDGSAGHDSQIEALGVRLEALESTLAERRQARRLPGL